MVLMAFFVSLVTKHLHDLSTAILYGILCFLPIIGLFILWKVNSQATEYLKDRGVPIGLLGANISKIKQAI